MATTVSLRGIASVLVVLVLAPALGCQTAGKRTAIGAGVGAADDRIKILGHTDAVGGKAYNEELSLRRADAVKRVLTGCGVQERQITALGVGEARPVASNDTPAGRKKNRRVELHIDVPNAT
jgi:flagellar motor protein MotB